MPFATHPSFQFFKSTGKTWLANKWLVSLLAVLVGGGVMAQPAPADKKIYKYLRGGAPIFSDVPPSTGRYVVYRPSCFACNLHSTIDWQTTPLHVDEYRTHIDSAARQFGMHAALVMALIHAESGFNPRARSPKGAMGLMQLMPTTAKQMGVANAYAPEQNIQGGSQYLAGLMSRFRNDVRLATAAYNAGPTAVQRYAGVPPYAETQVYVERVKILHTRYMAYLRSE
jgi:hypothetical protein